MSWTFDVDDVAVLFCTVPNEEVGARLARAIVEAGDAACVNLVPGLRSIYRWQGEICDDAELLLVMKTTRSRCEALSRHVSELHPYDTPELIALPVEAGLHAYLEWVRGETQTLSPQ